MAYVGRPRLRYWARYITESLSLGMFVTLGVGFWAPRWVASVAGAAAVLCAICFLVLTRPKRADTPQT